MSSPIEPLQQFIDDGELTVATSDIATDTIEINSISPDVPLRDPNLTLQDPHVLGDSILSTVENGSANPAIIANMAFDNSDETNTPYQEFPDEDDLSDLGIGRKLLSTKNSLELIPPRNHEKENATTRIPEHAPIIPVELQPLAGQIENNEFSKSVIQNLTNANIKANGHHVVWADTLDTNPFVIAKAELKNRMTILNHGEGHQNQNSNTGVCQDLFSAYSFKSNPPQGNVTEILYNSRKLCNDQEGPIDLSRMERIQMVASQRSHQNSIGQLYQSQACRGNYREEMGLNTPSAQNIHLGSRCPSMPSNNGESGNSDNAFTQTSLDVSEIPRDVLLNPSETCENLFEKLNGSDVQLQRSDHESQKMLPSDDFDSVSDDDWIPDEKPSALNLSVNYARTPDPLYVSGCVDPAYHSLINQAYKKDCRTWLYKNKAAKARVRARHQQVQEMLYFQKGG